MDLTRNDQDQLPEDAIEARASTYKGIMDFGYTLLLPVVLAVVMFITLLLRDVGLFPNLVISFLTYLGVLGIAKTFFVH